MFAEHPFSFSFSASLEMSILETWKRSSAFMKAQCPVLLTCGTISPFHTHPPIPSNKPCKTRAGICWSHSASKLQTQGPPPLSPFVGGVFLICKMGCPFLPHRATVNTWRHSWERLAWHTSQTHPCPRTKSRAEWMINSEKDSHLDLALPPAHPPATQRMASTFSSPKSFPTSAVTFNKKDEKRHKSFG